MTSNVVIESPYAGSTVEGNTEYARMCLKDSLGKNEAPIASHLLYTQVLDDTKEKDRELGINAGLSWLNNADYQIFYVDKGLSKGMLFALVFNMQQIGAPIQFRALNTKNQCLADFLNNLIKG